MGKLGRAGKIGWKRQGPALVPSFPTMSKQARFQCRDKCHLIPVSDQLPSYSVPLIPRCFRTWGDFCTNPGNSWVLRILHCSLMFQAFRIPAKSHAVTSPMELCNPNALHALRTTVSQTLGICLQPNSNSNSSSSFRSTQLMCTSTVSMLSNSVSSTTDSGSSLSPSKYSDTLLPSGTSLPLQKAVIIF